MTTEFNSAAASYATAFIYLYLLVTSESSKNTHTCQTAGNFRDLHVMMDPTLRKSCFDFHGFKPSYHASNSYAPNMSYRLIHHEVRPQTDRLRPRLDFSVFDIWTPLNCRQMQYIEAWLQSILNKWLPDPSTYCCLSCGIFTLLTLNKLYLEYYQHFAIDITFWK